MWDDIGLFMAIISLHEVSRLAPAEKPLQHTEEPWQSSSKVMTPLTLPCYRICPVEKAWVCLSAEDPESSCTILDSWMQLANAGNYAAFEFHWTLQLIAMVAPVNGSSSQFHWTLHW